MILELLQVLGYNLQRLLLVLLSLLRNARKKAPKEVILSNLKLTKFQNLKNQRANIVKKKKKDRVTVG